MVKAIIIFWRRDSICQIDFFLHFRTDYFNKSVTVESSNDIRVSAHSACAEHKHRG